MMKKIDTWLDIQKYVDEASRIASAVPAVVERDDDVGAAKPVTRRKHRRFRILRGPSRTY